MNQQLVISKEIVDYLVDKLPAFRKNEAIDLIEYIEQNFVVSDLKTEHFNCLLDKIDEIEHSQKKEEIKKIISYWMQEKKYFVNCSYVLNNDREILLAHHTLDKIYLQPFLTEKEIKKYNIKFNDLEIHNSKSFINPQHQQRLKHLPSIIPLEKDVFYDLIKIISPFIKNSKNVSIEDPYLPNPMASQNVLKIIKSFPDVNYNLVFLTKELYSGANYGAEENIKSEQYDAFIENISGLVKNGLRINFKNHYKSKTHRERYIFTEDFQIYIPGGFDFLTAEGFLKTKSNFDISEKLEIRIEKNNFNCIL